MKLFYLSILLTLSSYSFAQNTIRGKVTDKDNNLIEYFNAAILNVADSSYIKGGSFLNGQFEIQADGNEFLLRVSSPDYADKIILVKESNLGTIILDERQYNITEVVVTASQKVIKENKTLIFPTTEQKRNADDGYRLLYNLHLPKLNIDILNNSVSTFGGSVAMCINGREVTQAEVLELRPSDILRVEYYDSPEGRFADRAAVVDYITKQYHTGGYIKLIADQRLSYLDGKYLGMARLNNNKSEYSLGYRLNHSYDDKIQRDIYEKFVYPDNTSLIRIERSEQYNQRDNYNNIFANYNYRSDGNSFNVRAGYATQSNPINILSSQKYVPKLDTKTKVEDNSTDNSKIGYINSYWDRNTEKNNISVSVNMQYSDNSHHRDYAEYNNEFTKEKSFATNVREKYLSAIATMQYNHTISSTKQLSFSLIDFVSSTNSHYESGSDVTDKLSNNEIIFWAEYVQKWNKIRLRGRLGGSHSWYQQNHLSKIYLSLRPGLFAKYTIGKKSNLSVDTYMGNTFPRLYMLSDIEQPIDFIQVRRGNPNLKHSIIWTNAISYWQGFKNFDVVVNFSHNLFSPVSYKTVTYEDSRFIHSYASEGSYNELNPELILNLKLWGNLNLKLTSGLNYYILSTKDKRQLISFYSNIDISYTKNGWSLMAYYYSPTNRQSRTLDELYQSSLYGLSASYSLGMFMITAGTRNSLSNYETNINRYLGIYENRTSLSNQQNSKLFFVKLSYALGFGRKYDYTEINSNVSPNSAIVKGNRE